MERPLGVVERFLGRFEALGECAPLSVYSEGSGSPIAPGGGGVLRPPRACFLAFRGSLLFWGLCGSFGHHTALIWALRGVSNHFLKSLHKKRLAAARNVSTDIHFGEKHAPLASLNLLFATGFIIPYQGLRGPNGALVFQVVFNFISTLTH